MPGLERVIAGAIRAERARQGLSQAQLAQALGWTSPSSVSDLENGQRAIRGDDLVPLCTALGVTFKQLLDRADPDDLQALGLG